LGGGKRFCPIKPSFVAEEKDRETASPSARTEGKRIRWLRSRMEEVSGKPIQRNTPTPQKKKLPPAQKGGQTFRNAIVDMTGGKNEPAKREVKLWATGEERLRFSGGKKDRLKSAGERGRSCGESSIPTIGDFSTRGPRKTPGSAWQGRMVVCRSIRRKSDRSRARAARNGPPYWRLLRQRVLGKKKKKEGTGRCKRLPRNRRPVKGKKGAGSRQKLHNLRPVPLPVKKGGGKGRALGFSKKKNKRQGKKPDSNTTGFIKKALGRRGKQGTEGGKPRAREKKTPRFLIKKTLFGRVKRKPMRKPPGEKKKGGLFPRKKDVHTARKEKYGRRPKRKRIREEGRTFKKNVLSRKNSARNSSQGGKGKKLEENLFSCNYFRKKTKQGNIP